MLRSETRTPGACWRRFMFGKRSVPPATSIAFGPSPARIVAASATVRGRRYSNHGSRSIALLVVAVAAFPGRQDERGRRIRNRGEALRTHALVLVLQGLQYFVRRDRDLVDPHTDGVVDRVGDRRHDGEQRPLPDFF